jgi:hypothetical protein
MLSPFTVICLAILNDAKEVCRIAQTSDFNPGDDKQRLVVLQTCPGIRLFLR